MSLSNRKFFLVMLAIMSLVVSLGLTACSDDDSPGDPAGGGGDTPDVDTIAPLLLNSDPSPDVADLDIDCIISAYFSEPLDPASLDGNITISTGTLTNLVLVGGTEVEIRHEDWNPGDNVIVNFGVGIADTSGNHLAEETSFRYWVATDSIMILETTPEDGATDALRNTPISIKFNKAMVSNTLESGITVEIPGKAELLFSVESVGNQTYNIILDDTVPEDTHVMVTVGTECESWDGNLEEEYLFSYDTGSDLDSTPPELLGFIPASGSEISTNTNTLQIMFSEPVADTRLEIVSIDLMTILALEFAEVSGSWNPDKTTMTFTFATPLAPGQAMTIQLGDFHDAAGNINDSHPTWTATVSGTPDYYPVTELFAYTFFTHEEDEMGEWQEFQEKYSFELGIGEDFRRRRYDQSLGVWNEWDNMTKTSSGILLDGFREFRSGVGEDVTFSNPVKILNRPTVTASWTGNVDVTSGDDVLNVVFSAEVLPEIVDYPVFRVDSKGENILGLEFLNMEKSEAPFEVFWSNCRTVVQNVTASMDGDPVFTETDTLIYCPGFGLIKETLIEEQHMDDETMYSVTNLMSMEFLK